MKLLFLILTLLLYMNIYGQQIEHRWKSIDNNEKQKNWYDIGVLDSGYVDVINVWVMQMNIPPLVVDYIETPVVKTKTLYTINLKTAKYGILKAEYYDASNKNLQSFDYKIENLKDELKFNYPIMENSFLFKIIKDFIEKKK